MADSRSNGGPVSWVGGGLWVAANSMRNLAWYSANKFVWEERSGRLGLGLRLRRQRRAPRASWACARPSRRGTCPT